MKLFLMSLALLLVMEGIVFSLFPKHMRQCLEDLSRVEPILLRKMGICCLVLSVALGIYIHFYG